MSQNKVWENIIHELELGIIAIDFENQIVNLNMDASKTFDLASTLEINLSDFFSKVRIFNQNDELYTLENISGDLRNIDVFGTNVFLKFRRANTECMVEAHIKNIPLNNSKNTGVLLTFSPTPISTNRNNDSSEIKTETGYVQSWYDVLETIGDGFWDYTPKNEVFLYSEKWKNTFGYHDENIVDSLETWKSLIHPDDLYQVKSKLDEHLQGKTNLYSSKHRVKCKDEEYKWIIEQGKVIERDDKGDPLRMIANQNDISTQMHYQDSLTQSLAKQQELNELKTRFVSMASHEFRTPLATILLNIETLESYRDKMTEENIDTKIVRIKSNVIFLKNVIEKVLSLTHVESGKVKLKPSNNDFIKLIKQIIQEYYDFKNTSHEIIFNSSLDELRMFFDKQILEQVIKNLISNSIKYSPNSPKIHITLEAENNEVQLCVKDNGIGIPVEDLEKLFTPFFRARNVTNIRGTGLGLSLTREFVHLHDGQINVKSVLNEGTEFIVTMPIKSEDKSI